ncbi:Hypothetical protein CINCED_3A010885 [Cinara cedri]|uniref:Uncharacterized protein n=1 Tax=Cinara cedri TaxID=506608 RepID=A0A5E4NKV8_9HEMI|nr:Hypothetical protein CINCED_3A010885 [Cinara cedri]
MKPSTMSAATQRFTENDRPTAIRRFFSIVILQVCVGDGGVFKVGYATAAVTDDKQLTVFRSCCGRSAGSRDCVVGDGPEAAVDIIIAVIIIVTAVVAFVVAKETPAVAALTLTVQTAVGGGEGVGERQRGARRQLRHCVTLEAPSACMSAVPAVPF